MGASGIVRPRENAGPPDIFSLLAMNRESSITIIMMAKAPISMAPMIYIVYVLRYNRLWP